MSIKVYVVTDGDYSEFRVIGVCSTKEKAEELKTLVNSSNDIDEYELDVMPEHPKGMLPYQVWMDKDGNILSEKYCEKLIVKRTNAPIMQEIVNTIEPWVIFYVWAKDIEHAITIANDKRRELIALNLWRDLRFN